MSPTQQRDCREETEEKLCGRKVHKSPMRGIKNGIIAVSEVPQERTRGNGCKTMHMEFHMNTEQFYFFFLQRWPDTKTLPIKSPSSEMFIISLHTVLNNLLQLTALEGGRLD